MSKETKTVYADGWVTRLIEMADRSFHAYWLITIYAPSGETVLDRITYLQPSANDLMDIERLAKLRFAETEFNRGNMLVQ